MHVPAWLAMLGIGGAIALAGCTADVGDGDADSMEAAQSESAAFSFRPGVENVNRGQFINNVDIGNAARLAWLSKLSYESEAALRSALVRAGLQPRTATATPAELTGNEAEIRFFTVKARFVDTQAVYVRTRDVAVLAFRGTEPKTVADIMTDARTAKIRDVAWTGPVHKGFAEALLAAWKGGGVRDFLAARHYFDATRGGANSVARVQGVPLYLTGHSLGGALATLAADLALFDGCHQLTDQQLAAQRLTTQINYFAPCMQKEIPIMAVYTFGAPRTSTREGAHLLASRMMRRGTSMFRFVDGQDLVPSVPAAGNVFGPTSETYYHVGLASDCRIREGEPVSTFSCDPNPTYADRRYREATFRVQIMEKGVYCGGEEKRLSDRIDKRIQDHDLSRYMERLGAAARAGTSLPCARRSPT